MSHDMRLVGLIAAAIAQKNDEAVFQAYKPLTDDLADSVTAAVNGYLLSKLDWKGFVWFASRAQTSASRAEARAFGQRIVAFAGPPPRVVDPRRQQLVRLCFRVLRAGTTARALAKRMRDANATFYEPLPDQELDDLVVWCAKHHMEGLTDAR